MMQKFVESWICLVRYSELGRIDRNGERKFRNVAENQRCLRGEHCRNAQSERARTVSAKQRKTVHPIFFTRLVCREIVAKSSQTAYSEVGTLFSCLSLLFQTAGPERAWIQSGMTDLKHFAEKVKSHEQAKISMENALCLGMFGRVNIAAQPDEDFRIGITKTGASCLK